jgi:hypothetical protein
MIKVGRNICALYSLTLLSPFAKKVLHAKEELMPKLHLDLRNYKKKNIHNLSEPFCSV